MKKNWLLGLTVVLLAPQVCFAQKKIRVNPMESLQQKSHSGKPLLMSNTLPIPPKNEIYQPLIMARVLPKKQFKVYFKSYLKLLAQLENLNEGKSSAAKKAVSFESSFDLWSRALLIREAFAQGSALGFAVPNSSCFNAGWIAEASADLGVANCNTSAGDFNPLSAEYSKLRQQRYGMNSDVEQKFLEWGAQCQAQGQVPCSPLVGGWTSNGGAQCSSNSTSSCIARLASNEDQLIKVAEMLTRCSSLTAPMPQIQGIPSWMDCSFVGAVGAQMGAFVENGCANQSTGHTNACKAFTSVAQPVYSAVVAARAKMKEQGIAPEAATASAESAVRLADASCTDALKETIAGQLPAHSRFFGLSSKEQKVDRYWIELMQQAANQCQRSVQSMFDQYGVCSESKYAPRSKEYLEALPGDQKEVFLKGFCKRDREVFARSLNLSKQDAELEGIAPFVVPYDKIPGEKPFTALRSAMALPKVATKFFLEGCLKEASGIDFSATLGATVSTLRPPRFQASFDDKAPKDSRPNGCEFVPVAYGDVVASQGQLRPVAVREDGKCLGAFSGVQAGQLGFGPEDAVLQNDKGLLSNKERKAIKLYSYKCGPGSKQTPTGPEAAPNVTPDSELGTGTL